MAARTTPIPLLARRPVLPQPRRAFLSCTSRTRWLNCFSPLGHGPGSAGEFDQSRLRWSFFDGRALLAQTFDEFAVRDDIPCGQIWQSFLDHNVRLKRGAGIGVVVMSDVTRASCISNGLRQLTKTKGDGRLDQQAQTH